MGKLATSQIRRARVQASDEESQRGYPSEIESEAKGLLGGEEAKSNLESV